VLTCDWDDAPYLFFYSHKHRYTVFLDPNFMYAWRPQVWHTWNRMANGKDPDPLGTLQDFFKADYVYCTSDFAALRGQLSRTVGAQQVYPSAEAQNLHQRCLAHRDCRICDSNQDCPESMVCKHPGPMNREEKHLPKRCEQDPHVYIFRVKP